MKRILYTLFIFFITSTLFYGYDFTLSSIPYDNNTITIYRGKSMQTISNDSCLISMLATKVDDGIKFSASITNYSDTDYFFSENCISVYQGIYEQNNWKKIEYIPASIYFDNKKGEAKAAEILSAISLGLTIANAGHSTINGSGYVNGSRYTYTANVYSAADAAIATTNSYIALDNLQRTNQDYLSNLEDNLLFDSVIPAKNNYNGFFIVDEEKGPDYKVEIEISTDETFIFYFTRSDKDEILDPWKDKSHSRHSIVASVSPLINHFGLFYLFSRPKGVGFYGGLVLNYNGHKVSPMYETYSNLDNIYSTALGSPDPLNYGYTTFYKWKLNTDNSKTLYDSVGEYFGITIKTFPNTWITCGLGFDMKFCEYYYGDLMYKYSGSYKQPATDYAYYKSGWIKHGTLDYMISPQIGINCITNHIDLGCMATYSIPGKFNFDFSVGYAF